MRLLVVTTCLLLSASPVFAQSSDKVAIGPWEIVTSYRGNAFVTIFGSWLKPGVQTGIQRVILTPNGNTYIGETSWFVRFPAGVMPLPISFGPDDALYVGDYINDAIYRISYGLPE